MTRTAAAKARARARVNCPTPTKHAYTTDEAIGRALHRSGKAGIPLRIYHCPCGYQHLTKQPEKAATPR